jgi:hypothetical protein
MHGKGEKKGVEKKTEKSNVILVTGVCEGVKIYFPGGDTDRSKLSIMRPSIVSIHRQEIFLF